jgi:hypothetical protein
MAMGLLVGSFGDLVHMRGSAAEASPPVQETNYPPEFTALRDRLGHHLVLLSLLARSDGEFADVERNVIIEHCASIAGLDAEQCSMIDEYLRQSRPALTQLDPALKRLETEDPSNIKALIDSAERLIRAGGKVDPAEQRLLERMRAELG